MAPFTDEHDIGSYARTQWEDGEARLVRMSRDSARRRALEDVVDGIMYELEKRVGQTFTTAQLAQEFEDAERWCTEVAHERAPEEPAAWDLSIVQSAAFWRFSRRAQDYQA